MRIAVWSGSDVTQSENAPPSPATNYRSDLKISFDFGDCQLVFVVDGDKRREMRITSDE